MRDRWKRSKDGTQVFAEIMVAIGVEFLLNHVILQQREAIQQGETEYG